MISKTASALKDYIFISFFQFKYTASEVSFE